MAARTGKARHGNEEEHAAAPGRRTLMVETVRLLQTGLAIADARYRIEE